MSENLASKVSPPAEWYAAYPGTRYTSQWKLMSWFPRGVLDASRANGIIQWLEAVEPRIGSFNRFIDLSRISTVTLGMDEVANIASRRKAHYRGAPVKAVILATSPLAYGIARMYEQLIASLPIDVHVVSQLAAASEILRLPTDALNNLSAEE